MKKDINIKFSNFWYTFNPYKNFFTEILSKEYNVHVVNEMDENLDLLIGSTFGFPDHDTIKGKFKKVYFTPENDFPNLNMYDYAFTHYDFDHERHVRFPHWVWYHYYREHNIDREYHNHFINEPNFTDEEIFNHRWTSLGMVISNGSTCDPFKNDLIFNMWDQYPIASGGRWRNNVTQNEHVENKIEFLKYYRASIAFENSISNGYVTEKLYEAFVANGIPVYWGDSKCAKMDFNPKAFLDVNDYPNVSELMKDITDIVNDKSRFMDMINTPRNFKYQEYEDRILEKLYEIIEHGKIFNHKYGRLYCSFAL